MKKQKISSIPRTIEDLSKVAADLTFQLGKLAYQISVHETEAQELKKQLLEINLEGAERNKLDAAFAKEDVANKEAASGK